LGGSVQDEKSNIKVVF